MASDKVGLRERSGMTAVREVLVVGGGLGGLSAAIALTDAGCSVHLVEQAMHWSALGAGLTFNGATARAFKSLGVLDRVVEAGYVHGSSDICDKDGNVLSPGSDEPVYGPGVPVSGGILRPVLHAILQQAFSSRSIRCSVGTTVASWDEGADGITARLSDGSSQRYDLVVAADGLMSSTRRTIFPHAPSPTFTGQGAWRAIAPRPPEVTTSKLYLGGRHKAGINPVSDDQMYLFLLVNATGNPRHADEDLPGLLKEALADYGGHVAQVREGLGERSHILYRPLETLVMPKPWNVGRILLIGDAAHATTPHVGYGAGLAMEDGVILGELVRAGLDAVELPTVFTERRYDRCAAVVEGSVELGELEMAQAPIADQTALYSRIYAKVRETA